MLAIAVLIAVLCRQRSKLTVSKAIASVAAFWCVMLAGAMVLSSLGCPWSEAIVAKKRAWAHFAGGLFMMAYGWRGLGYAFGKAAEGEEVSHDAMPHG